MEGEKKINAPKRLDRILARIGKAETIGARFFGASIRASKQCNHCGLCAQNCPMQNIAMKQGCPKFGFHCLMCLKCIYACPQKALSPRILKFVVLKKGYDLTEMSKNAQLPCKIKYSNAPNKHWQGIIDYLKE